MLTSVRIKIGLQAFHFVAGRKAPSQADQPLRPREGVRLLERIHGRELRRLEGLVTALSRRGLTRDEELRRILAQLIVSERVHVQRIEAKIHRTIGKIDAPVERPPPAPIDNEIIETYSLMIELIDADEQPVPGEPFRVKLPDGSVETGTLDDEGKAYITGIERAGTCKVCFYERDAGAWSQI